MIIFDHGFFSSTTGFDHFLPLSSLNAYFLVIIKRVTQVKILSSETLGEVQGKQDMYVRNSESILFDVSTKELMGKMGLHLCLIFVLDSLMTSYLS